MKFTPLENENNLLSSGEYDYRVIDASDEVSKGGNEMIKLTLEITQAGRRKTVLFDFLLEKIPWKLKAFCETNEMSDKYASGELNSDDCRNKIGRLLLAVDPGKEDPKNGGKFPDKNVVKKYLKSNLNVVLTDDNSDVPF